MLLSKSWLLLSLNFAGSFAASNTSKPIVDLGYVKYEGNYNETLGVQRFYGIRYAAAPVGDLRWRAAVPIENKNNYTHGKKIDASIPGPQCVQPPPGPGAAGFFELLSQVPGAAQAVGAAETPKNNSEDCLLLDVIVPSKPKSKLLPVVIQIHGGSYTSGNSQLSDGGNFVSFTKGSVVYVQLQYRLGPYGFLGAKEVLADGDANIGLTDQRAAFAWVQRHIQAFGGDPTKVTIWGGSAGGGSVLNHMIINASDPNPPFRAAIAEFPWWQPYHDTPVLEAQYRQLLNASGCSDLACLRKLPCDVLANATFAAANMITEQGTCGFGDGCYGPYVDGHIIRDLISHEFAQGNFVKVPLLTDHDGEEGVLFQNQAITTADEGTADLRQLWPAARSSFFTRLYQLYPLSAFGGSSFFSQSFFSSAFYKVVSGSVPNSNLTMKANDMPYWRLTQIFGDFTINCPTYFAASAVADAGQSVWKLVCTAGIYVHGAVGVYVLADSSDTPDVAIANNMKDWYLSFITHLDPNKGPAVVSNSSRPMWPQYHTKNATQFTIMRLNDTSVGPEQDPDASDRCDFLHSQSYVVRN